MKKTIILALAVLFVVSNTARAHHIFKYVRTHDTTTPFIYESNDVKFVCERPCPFSNKNREKAFRALQKELRTIEKNIGFALPASLKPIETHLRFDKTCEQNRRISAGENHTLWAHTTTKADGKALICLNKPEIEDVIAHRSVFSHEVGHHYFPLVRTQQDEDIEHGIVNLMGYFVRRKKNQTMCDPILQRAEPMSYRLCTEYGFDYGDIPELVRRMREKAAADGAFSEKILKRLIKEISTFPPK